MKITLLIIIALLLVGAVSAKIYIIENRNSQTFICGYYTEIHMTDNNEYYQINNTLNNPNYLIIDMGECT